MKKLLTTSTIFATIISMNSLASSAAQHKDLAKVTLVKPVYQTIEHRIPKEHCWVETVRESVPARHRKQSGTPALVGGIIGGVIGNEVGRGGDNKKIGAVVGSILGMSIAKDIHRQAHASRDNRDSYHYRDVERCEVSHRIETEQVLKGYDVEYRYNDRRYHTFMRQHPGEKLRVAVEVRPLSH